MTTFGIYEDSADVDEVFRQIAYGMSLEAESPLCICMTFYFVYAAVFMMAYHKRMPVSMLGILSIILLHLSLTWFFLVLIPIVLRKDPDLDEHGNAVFDAEGKQRFRCGFKIGGGIDQDPHRSPQGYPDKGVYITFIYENSPAHHAGLQIHDKILQVNGHDFTVVTHKKAVEYIKRKPTLNMLVYRKGVPQLQKPMAPQPQFQSYAQQQGYNQYSGPNSPQPQQFPQQQRQY